MNNIKKNLLLIILAISIIVISLLGTLVRYNSVLTERNNLYIGALDSIQTLKDKDGLNVSRIAVLESEKVATFIKLQNQNKTTQELQGLVDKYKKQLGKTGVATIIKTEIKYDTIFQTEKVVDSLNCLPLPYERTIINEWVTLSYKIEKDSTAVYLKSRDELEFIIGEEKKGIFKKPVPFAQVTNKNIFSTTKDLRVYRVTDSRKRYTFALSPGISYGLDINGNQNVLIGVSLTPEKFKIRF